MAGKVLRGIVRGNTIELLGDPGVADGDQVEVFVKPLLPKSEPAGAGFLRTEGALAGDAEWDAIMEEIHEFRSRERTPQWGDA